MTAGSIQKTENVMVHKPGFEDGVYTVSHSENWSGSDGRQSWCNHYVKTVTDESSARGFVYRWDNDYRAWLPWGDPFALYCSEPHGGHMQALLDEATSKALESLATKVQGHDFDAPMAFAEIDKTVKMITDRARTLAQYVNLLRKHDAEGAFQLLTTSGSKPNLTSKLGGKDFLKSPYTKPRKDHKIFSPTKAMADAHLEFRFGWDPLIQDVYAGAEALAASTHHVRTEIVSATKTLKTDLTLGNSRYDLSASVKLRSDYKVGYEKPASNPLIPVAEVAWERTHYSFVFDWVLPVGKLIQDMRNLQIVGGLIMMTQKTNTKGKTYPYKDTDDVMYGFVGDARYSSFGFSRKLLDQTLWGTMVRQHLNLQASTTHMLHSLALSRNIAGGRKY